MAGRASSPSLPTLPSLPVQPVTQAKRPALPRLVSSSRKRFYGSQVKLTHESSIVDDNDLASAFTTSSDPAFFSSDETPDLENYSVDNKRRKKVYSGTWWSGRLRSSKMATSGRAHHGGGPPGPNVTKRDDREFRRNYDSGIFMGDETDGNSSGGDSSGTQLSSDGLLEELKASQSNLLDIGHEQDQRVAYRQHVHNREGADDAQSTRTVKKLRLEDLVSGLLSPTDIKINEIVQRCLEASSPDVDLTNMGIEQLPSTITQLRTLVKLADSLDEQFEPLSCSLRIYLANNRLSIFPGHLLHIPSIELLSLRQNQLTELPDSISNLRKLKELNLSGNNLEYLPYNILRLLDNRLRLLQSEPNPWRTIPQKTGWLTGFPTLQISRPTNSLRRLVIERATEYEANGTIKRHQPRHKAHISPYSVTPTNKTSSLSEMILRNVTKLHTAATDLSTLIETEFCSDTVKEMLHRMYILQRSGERRCTFCDRSIILPRYQWLEWWDVNAPTPPGSSTIPPTTTDPQATRPPTQMRYQVLDHHPSTKPEPEIAAQAIDLHISNAGKILPFVRYSCGCQSQTDGLTQESHLWRDITAFYKSSTHNGDGSSSMVDESPRQREREWEWPCPTFWEEIKPKNGDLNYSLELERTAA